MTARGRSRPEQDAHAGPILPRTTPTIGRTAPQGSRPVPPGGEAVLRPRFAQTPDFTVGVEEELQLVHPDDGSLAERPEAIESVMATSEGRLQAEVFSSTIETTTPVCGDAQEMGDEMRRLRAWVVDAAEDHGLALAAAGTHPFARWETEATSKSPRFEQLISELKLPMMSDLVFGQHVHVSVGSPEEAIQVTNEVQPFLPLILALSANAPFWRGLDSGLQSARTNVSAGMPRSGLPPAFADWEAFEAHVGWLQQAGSIEDTTELWWDVRPRPDLGTVEIRIADQPTGIDTSVSLAAFTHALVVHLAKAARQGEQPPLKNPRAIVEENRWRALRNGHRAGFIEGGPDGGSRVLSLREAFDRTVDAMAPTIRRLGVEDEIGHLRKRIRSDRSDADRQRSIYQAEADLAAVVHDLVDRSRS